MAIYYASPSVTDTSGDGSYASPWNINHALLASRTSFGDALYLLPGAFADLISGNTQISPVIGGAYDNNPLIIAPYSEAVTIDFSGWAGLNRYFYLLGDYMKFQNIKFANSNTVAKSIFTVGCGGSGIGSGLYLEGGELDAASVDAIPINVADATETYPLNLGLDGFTIKNVGGSDGAIRYSQPNAANPGVFDIQDSAFDNTPEAVSILTNLDLTFEGNACQNGTAFGWMDIRAGSSLAINNNDFYLSATTAGVLAKDATGAAYYTANPTHFTHGNNRLHADTSQLGLGTGVGDPALWGKLWNADANSYISPDTTDSFVADDQTPGDGKYFAFLGDSIPWGNAATDYLTEDTNTVVGQFRALSGRTNSNRDYAALGGMQTRGALWYPDLLEQTEKPKVCFVSIGINNILTGFDQDTTMAEIEQIMARLESRGVLPIWIGIGNASGYESEVAAVNAAVEVKCLENGWYYTDWSKVLGTSATYYSDYASNVHPNDAGHAKIAETALFEWLYTDPVCAPLVCRPVECRQVRCMPIRARS